MKRYRIIVEGINDKNFLDALCQQYDVAIADNCKVFHADGYENAILDFVNALGSLSSYNGIGLILDADANAQSRYDELRVSINNQWGEQYQLPKNLSNVGIISEVNGCKLGVWIMPNCKDEGALEDFLLNKIKSTNQLLPMVEDAIDFFEQEGKTPDAYAAVHRSKALMRTYMAWKEPPDLSLKDAILKDFFPNQTEWEKTFAQWLFKIIDETLED